LGARAAHGLDGSTARRADGHTGTPGGHTDAAATLRAVAKDIYTAGLEALKRRYRERRDITGIEYDDRQRALHEEWQTRRVDLARRYVYVFADARLKEIQEQAYEAARTAADAVWERAGSALIESYSLPEPPAWAAEPEHGVEDDDRPAAVRRQSRAVR